MGLEQRSEMCEENLGEDSPVARSSTPAQGRPKIFKKSHQETQRNHQEIQKIHQEIQQKSQTNPTNFIHGRGTE